MSARKSKETMGSWRADLREVDWKDANDIRKLLKVARGKGFYTVCSDTTLVAMTLSDSEASAANAKLMSAAPELHLALQTCLEALDGAPEKRMVAKLQAKRALEKIDGTTS